MNNNFWRRFNNFLEILFFPWYGKTYDKEFKTAAILKIIAVVFIVRSIFDLFAGGIGGMTCNLIPGIILYSIGCHIQYGKSNKS